MRPHEGLTVAYFAAFAIAALATHAPARRRRQVCAAAVAMAVGVAAIASYGTDAFRAWIPHVYLVTGYWLPGVLARHAAHPTRFEGWLQGPDRWLRPGNATLSPLLRHVIELAYLVCYPLIPASLAVVWTSGSLEDVNRFWLAVLAAGYACYASLPWLVSRPPRLVQPSGPHRIAAVNVRMLGRVSHELNTFPSGHVAVSLAAAAGVAQVSTLAGAAVLLIGAAIAVGAVAGRYHYVIDVLLGVIVAGVVALAALI